MSAHLMFFYSPQREAVIHWMHETGAPVGLHSPVGVHHPDQLRGLGHINFIEIVGHHHPVPPPIWTALRERGAIILKVDDTWSRELRVIAEHLPPPVPRRIRAKENV